MSKNCSEHSIIRFGRENMAERAKLVKTFVLVMTAWLLRLISTVQGGWFFELIDLLVVIFM